MQKTAAQEALACWQEKTASSNLQSLQALLTRAAGGNVGNIGKSTLREAFDSAPRAAGKAEQLLGRTQDPKNYLASVVDDLIRRGVLPGA